MASSGEEGRKKRRDCDKVDQSVEEEKSKKVRVGHQSSSSTESSAVQRAVMPDSSSFLSPLKYASAATTASSNEISASSTSQSRRVWDIESALLYLLQVETDEKEFLTNDKSAWATFRVGHAGDASTIANWYRQEQRVLQDVESPELKKQPEDTEGDGEETTSSSMLEISIAEGMGDEGNPPSLYSLVAHVQYLDSSESSSPEKSTSEASTKVLGAVALMTVAFANDERILRVEWISINSDLPREAAKTLEQRMWLRLSTLSVMTACQVVTVDRKFTTNPTETKSLQPPSAE